MHLYRDQNGDFLASVEKVDLRTEDLNLKYSREVEILGDAKLEKLIAKLDQKHRDILLARKDGLSYQEISEKFGIPLGTVMSRLFWAKRRLEKASGEKYNPPRGESQNWKETISGFNGGNQARYAKFIEWRIEFEVVVLKFAVKGFYIKDLPAQNEVSDGTMRDHIKTMVRNGKLKVHRDGIGKFYELS